MKTIAQLSERERKKYITLAKLGIPLEFRRFGGIKWTAAHPRFDLIGWLYDPLDTSFPHTEWHIRRKPK